MLMTDILSWYMPAYDAEGEGSGDGDDGEGKKPGEGEGKGEGEGEGKGAGEGEGGEGDGDDKNAKTILSKGEGEGDDKPSTWDELKIKVAGEDEKLKGRLDRYTSFEAFAKAGLSAQDKVRSGEVKAPLAEGASDEEKVAWREANNIPAKPEDYTIPEMKNFKFEESEKPVVDSFLAAAHSINASQEFIDKTVGWYAETLTAGAEAQFNQDTQNATELDDAMRTELGVQFRGTINVVDRFIQDKQKGLGAIGEDIMQARLPNGKRLGDTREFMDYLAAQSLKIYGQSAFIAGDEMQAMTTRKEEIMAVMKSDMNRYRQEGLDKEYQTILEREAGAGRSAA